ncbi:MAG: hypothetical protein HY808_16460 [Nitrospirae bacterium]|nr:hypothetical protein [Nitrospirota bacterium]
MAAAIVADLKDIENAMRMNVEKALPLQGVQLLQFYRVRKDRISGYPVIVTEYRRSGPKGPVIVQVNQIFTESQTIGVNLSYRESETALWKPVIEQIRQSITVAKWP